MFKTCHKAQFSWLSSSGAFGWTLRTTEATSNHEGHFIGTQHLSYLWFVYRGKQASTARGREGVEDWIIRRETEITESFIMEIDTSESRTEVHQYPVIEVLAFCP